MDNPIYAAILDYIHGRNGDYKEYIHNMSIVDLSTNDESAGPLYRNLIDHIMSSIGQMQPERLRKIFPIIWLALTPHQLKDAQEYVQQSYEIYIQYGGWDRNWSNAYEMKRTLAITHFSADSIMNIISRADVDAFLYIAQYHADSLKNKKVESVLDKCKKIITWYESPRIARDGSFTHHAAQGFTLNNAVHQGAAQ